MSNRELPTDWRRLIECGWVHVTGLPTQKWDNQEGGLIDGRRIFPKPDFEPGVGRNNGMSVVYAPDGTVWLHSGFSPLPILSFGWPQGNAYVPCSNGEALNWHHTMDRIADPFYDGGFAMSYSDPAFCQGKPLSYKRFPATREDVLRHPEFLEYAARIARQVV